MAEKSRYLTVMVMPEAAGAEVRRIRVRRAWLIGAPVAALLALVVGFLGAGSALGARAKVREGQQLRAENEAMRASLVSLEAQVAKARRAVDRVGRLEAKLRAMTMVSDPARSIAMGPVGGRGESRGPALPLGEEFFARNPVGLAGQVEEGSRDVGIRADAVADRLEGLSALLSQEERRIASTPSRRPSKGYMSSGFGMRMDPFTGLPQRHRGLDFVAPMGSEVRATADGTVRVAGPRGAYGLIVELDHGHGLTTRYAHLSKAHVRAGQKVERGAPIGEVGNSGRSTGPHLHYEVRLHGVPRDPRAFILE